MSASKETKPMAARTPQTTDATLADYTDPETIAASLETPWENATVLNMLYNERDLSVDRIANEIFDQRVCTETVRRRLHAHDLMDREPTLAEQLADPDVGPEDIGLEETPDNSHARFSKRGGSA